MINLHFDNFFDDYRDDQNLVQPEVVKDVVEEIVFDLEGTNSPLISDLINGTLSEVNWEEIADHYNTED
jgi:hypothetical protein